MVQRNAIIEKMKSLMPKYKPSEAYIFGSYAYGDPSPDSDLDLLLITEEEQKLYYKTVIHDLYQFDVAVELLVMDKATFRERLAWNHFFKTIYMRGLKIYG